MLEWSHDPRLVEATSQAIRPFLARHYLTAQRAFQVRHFYLADRGAAAAQEVLLGAIRGETDADLLCAAITSPLGQAAITALGWEFPVWAPVLDLLQAAARVYCAERRWERTGQAVAVGAVTLAVAAVIASLWGD
jgi:hypothetical protein